MNKVALKRKIVTLILLLALSTASCWNRRELNELAFVMGVGLDLGSEPDTVTFTSQVVKPALINTGTSGNSEPNPYFNITDTGRTVFEAIRKSSRKIDRRLYFPHSLVIIFSEELAKKGVSTYLDLLARDPEFRRDGFVLVCKGRASDILQAQTQIGDIPGRSIYQLVKRRKAAALASGVTLHQFLQRLMSNTTAPLASLVESSEDGKTLKLTGTSVFKEDRLAGYLNETETRGLLWVLGEVNAGIVIVQCPAGDGKVSLEIVSSSGKIIPQVRGDKLQLLIRIQMQGHLAEQTCSEDLTKLQAVDFLEKELEDVVRGEIESAISKAREFGCDIFGFGERIKKKNSKLWQQIKGDWEQGFREIPVTLEIEAKLTRTGMTNKPGRPADE